MHNAKAWTIRRLVFLSFMWCGRRIRQASRRLEGHSLSRCSSATKMERYYVDALLKLHVRPCDGVDGIFDGTVRYRARAVGIVT
jgi:hypothetical protein